MTDEPTPENPPAASTSKAGTPASASSTMTNWGLLAVLTLVGGAGFVWVQWSTTDSIDNDIAFLRVMDPTTAIVGAILGLLLLAVVYQLRMMRAEMRELLERTDARP